MLIEGYEENLSFAQCHPGCDELVARVSVRADLTAVMPYLNAELARAEYNREMAVLTWSDGERRYAVRPHEVAVDELKDREQAAAVVGRTISWINEIWERRAGITPDYSTWTPPPLLAILKLLPRMNCRECGCPTCTAFALELAEGRKQVLDCPPLAGDDENVRKLEEMGF